MVTDVQNAREQARDAEWAARCELAALYRVLHHLRMTDLTETHSSVRVPGEDGTMLINRYGDLFDEVTASSLVKMDFDGNVIGSGGAFNGAGFNIHSAAYIARPEINCVIHTHTRSGIAVAATERGLLPISQHALVVLDEVVYHDYDGPGVIEAREAVAASCARGNCVVMRNHGMLALGERVPVAFKRIYYMETAAQIQCSASAMDAPLRPIDEDVQRRTAELHRQRRASADYGEREWSALLRRLERDGADYRQ